MAVGNAMSGQWHAELLFYASASCSLLLCPLLSLALYLHSARSAGTICRQSIRCLTCDGTRDSTGAQAYAAVAVACYGMVQSEYEALSRAERKVFIGNLPPRCSPGELSDALRLCGEVSD